MAALNKVMVIGNLGRDPEVRMAGSTKVANFSVAVTERYNDRNGQRQEKTEWINIVLWARLAEIAEQYLKKGSTVYVEGKLETQSWDDKDGNKKYRTEVRGLSMQMLGGRGQSSEGGSNYGGASNSGGFNQAPAAAPSDSFNQAPEVVEDDLPF
jgi:single-strand DNA-binding protein